jgi:polyribonucleotide nucleotidyltransferase
VKDLHERSIKSTTLTIAGYLREIRTLLNEDHNLQDTSNGCFSPVEQEAVAATLANMEAIIERCWDEFSFSKGEIDLKWKVLILAETMDNLVHDMSADRLNKKYGSPDSAEEREKIGRLQEELRAQIRRLKDVSAGTDRSSR